LGQDISSALGPQHARDLRDERFLRGDVLHGLERDEEVRAGIVEWQPVAGGFDEGEVRAIP
jgi:hypothetical protein